jgi:hypothetical protein
MWLMLLLVHIVADFFGTAWAVLRAYPFYLINRWVDHQYHHYDGWFFNKHQLLALSACLEGKVVYQQPIAAYMFIVYG